MKFRCKCGLVTDIPLSDCATALGNEGIKAILRTPEQTRKDWQSRGGLARAKYSKEQLSEWAKRGGRPRKVKK